MSERNSIVDYRVVDAVDTIEDERSASEADNAGNREWLDPVEENSRLPEMPRLRREFIENGTDRTDDELIHQLSRMNLPRSEESMRWRRNQRSIMKPGKFDGTGSLESFLTQFEVCAKHNRWYEGEKADFLQCALDKAATQLLWDFGSKANMTYDNLVERLRQRYGMEGQAETFRIQLKYRKQRERETLSDLLHDVRRLVVLAYPVPSSETTDIIARDAFLDALADRDLSLKVREREPKTLDEAFRIAMRLEAYCRMSSNGENRRDTRQVRSAQEIDYMTALTKKLDDFMDTQREIQERWQLEFSRK